ncbi:unnamed protein product [Linum trigynum]|uniref:Uncharacterized protein n=1 Tax=Linum trigynum TaxID=586398 RepID=A0AAV2D8M7_9ROSI
MIRWQRNLRATANVPSTGAERSRAAQNNGRSFLIHHYLAGEPRQVNPMNHKFEEPPSPSPPWDHRLHHTITNILLTSPTTAPPLYSQFLIAQQFSCYLNWDKFKDFRLLL